MNVRDLLSATFDDDDDDEDQDFQPLPENDKKIHNEHQSTSNVERSKQKGKKKANAKKKSTKLKKSKNKQDVNAMNNDSSLVGDETATHSDSNDEDDSDVEKHLDNYDPLFIDLEIPPEVRKEEEQKLKQQRDMIQRDKIKDNQSKIDEIAKNPHETSNNILQNQHEIKNRDDDDDDDDDFYPEEGEKHDDKSENSSEDSDDEDKKALEDLEYEGADQIENLYKDLTRDPSSILLQGPSSSNYSSSSNIRNTSNSTSLGTSSSTSLGTSSSSNVCSSSGSGSGSSSSSSNINTSYTEEQSLKEKNLNGKRKREEEEEVFREEESNNDKNYNPAEEKNSFQSKKQRISKTDNIDNFFEEMKKMDKEQLLNNKSATSISSFEEKKNIRASSKLQDVLSKMQGKKSSTLSQSKKDWNEFKKREGIEEELKQYTKDGYLERQAFLDRTELREFEAGKDLRNKERERQWMNAKK